MKKLLLVIIMLSTQNAIANFSDVCDKFPRHPICENCRSEDGVRGMRSGLVGSCSVNSMEIGNRSSITGLISNLYVEETIENVIDTANPEFLDNSADELDELFLESIDEYDTEASNSFKNNVLRISEMASSTKKVAAYLNAVGIRDSLKIKRIMKNSETLTSVLNKALRKRIRSN